MSVAFDVLARRWPTGGFRGTSLYCLLAGVMGAALAVVTGGMEEELAERAGAPESVLELHESLGAVTLIVFVALLGLRLAMQWGWTKDLPVFTFGLGVIGIVILALTGYWGGKLVYVYGIGVQAVMAPATP